MKKYNEKSNVIGNLIYKKRKKLGLSKSEVCRKLQLHAIYLDHTELYRMEEGIMVVKDFELIGLCKVLKIDFDELIKLID